MKRVWFILIGVGMLLTPIIAQDMVYLEHCETLSFDQKRLPDAQLLKGDVRFRHEDALMFCDSAYFYEKTNSLDAFGHVRFVQGDTLEGVGEILHYNGNTKLARLHYNVVLTHITTVLTTDSLNYDRVSNLAYYFTGGTIRDGQDLLSSVWGAYNVSRKTAEFRDKVHLQNKSFTLDADSLVYKTAEHVALLVKPTTIVYEDETTILSSDGWYNTSTERSMLLSRSLIIHKDGKQLTGDTIFYDRKPGIGNVFGHMEMSDTVQKVTLLGNYGIMREKEKSGFATDSAYILDWSQPNKSYIHADTIFTEEVPYRTELFNDSIVTDTIITQDTLFHRDTLIVIDTLYCQDTLFIQDTLYVQDIFNTIDTVLLGIDTVPLKTDTIADIDLQITIDSMRYDSIVIDTLYNEHPLADSIRLDSTYRQVRAYFHVRGYSNDYQFVCDSMTYNGRDSIVILHHEPVCWSESNQISADTIFIILNDSSIDYIHGIGAAFGSKQEGPDEFDQLSGKEMKAFIRQGELKEIQVSGNAETVFYPRNDDSTYVGVNKSQSSYVNMFIENNKIHHVLFTTATTGTLYPLSQIDPADTRLVGFFWATQERPTDPHSIFLRPERTKRPVQKAISAVEEDEEEETSTPKKDKKRNRKEK